MIKRFTVKVTMMADQNVVHIGENSPEYVAYRLFKDIARIENKTGQYGEIKDTNSKWILETYAECLNAVKSSPGRPYEYGMLDVAK